MMEPSWHEQMVQLLIEQRRAGELDFGRAWRRAQAACSSPRPRDFVVNGNADDEGWLPYSTFVRHACEREWHGLVHTDFLHLRELLEDSGLSSATPREKIVGASRVQILA